MKVVNLTPHEINIIDDDNKIVIGPSGVVARSAEKRAERPAITIDGQKVSVSLAEYGQIEGLPAPQPDTIYVVSSLVLAAVPERPDVFAPGPAVRDAEGRVIGCRGLSCTPAYRGLTPDDDSASDLSADVLATLAAEARTTATWRPQTEREIISRRSTNGRWSVEVAIEPGVLHNVRHPGLIKGQVEVVATGLAIIRPGDQYYWLADGEVERRLGTVETLISISLQSGRYFSLCQVELGAVWVEYGYKRRTDTYYRLGEDGEVTVLGEIEKAQARASWVAETVRAAAGERWLRPAFSFGKYYAVAGQGLWRVSVGGYNPAEIVYEGDNCDVALEAMKNIAPLARWRAL